MKTKTIEDLRLEYTKALVEKALTSNLTGGEICKTLSQIRTLRERLREIESRLHCE